MNENLTEIKNDHYKPWLSIWFHPRKTIRSIAINNTRYALFLLAALFGTYKIIDQSSKQSLGDLLPFGAIIGLSLVLGIFVGLLNIYLYGACMHMVGSVWFGGKATIDECRAAAAWSMLPEILGLIIFIPVLIIFQEDWFLSYPGKNLSTLINASMIIVPIGLGLRLWRAILFIECFGELNEHSFWRSLLVSAICFAIFVLAGFILSFANDLFFGRI